MKLIKINKDQLNTFTSQQRQAQFLQSFEWGEFQSASGAKVFYYGLEKDGKIILAFSLFEKSLFAGKKYFYCPRVDLSILSEEDKSFLIDELKGLAERNNVIFLRTEPIHNFRLPNSKFRIAKTIDIQASKTSILDISKAEDDLLKSFHQKTRYNIRLAEKKGVRVRVGTEADFEKFWEIMTETKDRDGFRLHAREYYKRMLSIPFIELVVAEFEGKIIAANIVSYFGDMASYIHGSSSNQQRNVMAPFAIQWFSINRAKVKGCKFYDFNGIDEAKWPGVTRFKRGFNGEEIVYPGCFDVVFGGMSYWVYVVVRSLRRMIGRVIGR